MYKIKYRPDVDDLLGAEQIDPSPQKDSKDRITYTSGPFRNVMSLGIPVLADFRHALIVDQEGFQHIVQRDAYRAPEVILGSHWGYGIDI